MRDFQMLMLSHESIVSKLIGIDPVQKTEFSDYEGVVKSLGAWGGDFVLACGPTKSKRIFCSKKGLQCVFRMLILFLLRIKIKRDHQSH